MAPASRHLDSEILAPRGARPGRDADGSDRPIRVDVERHHGFNRGQRTLTDHFKRPLTDLFRGLKNSPPGNRQPLRAAKSDR
jgi:hypothetical protein